MPGHRSTWRGTAARLAAERARLSSRPSLPARLRDAQRRGWRIGGRVQGVGFRPFVYRLAHDHGLTGWVRNQGGEVEIHAEGPVERLRLFGDALLSRAPPAAAPRLVELRGAALERGDEFEFSPSAAGASSKSTCRSTSLPARSAWRSSATARHAATAILSSIARSADPVTPDPRDAIRSAEYDARSFRAVPQCAAEYAEPLDRRFHAQPLACPACGPRLYWRAAASSVDGNAPALGAALSALREGQIVAVRGVGGYHLLCDAANEHAVVRLRDPQGSTDKAVGGMVPWRGPDGLDCARSVVRLTPPRPAPYATPCGRSCSPRAAHARSRNRSLRARATSE